ncbi:DNA-binding response regulator, OmpR family, contains REC and winged-helix (wHTH) domain [Clostridium collagenovorans DSM 3089]|uniref:Stage 0 sporulation protein A homolog n=1 Tax=Clostridium collagenovorans DSM 3089 TaxID=1121306 RepID=A0A1M5X702_9CLOT|nr:response regulator transcription factor [Clostridium collagenovorans]SHH95620.1 DNA-binding response regulator, OmpR family, contains REC and winged-helix (wHTH) domain [Clostridium collagenovorans DSM 3089]
MENKSVLIVEDEEKINKMVSDYFKFNGFGVISVSDGMEAVEKFNDDIDLVILDVMLPKLDGFTVIRRIRKKSNVPVIMVTARGDDEDVLMGYELKVDDYIIKPFSLEILIAKAKVLLNRIDSMTVIKEHIKEDLLNYNGVKLDKLKMEVYIDDEKVELEPKQFEILQYLMENKNIVISREKILEVKWGYDYFGNTRVVDAQIKKLRKNLQHKSYCIKTVFGAGYKFDVE